MTTQPLSYGPTWSQLVNSFAVSPNTSDLRELQQDGATAIIDLAGEYQAGRDSQDRELVARVIGRMSDIQVRDFALGSHNEQTRGAYLRMWADLLAMAPDGFIAPLATLSAALAYESGELELAFAALDQAAADDSGYSLASLLRRVFTAGWPADSFQAMRSELHPKVVAGIFG